MAELLLRKAMLVRDRIAKVRGALPAKPEAVADDERLANAGMLSRERAHAMAQLASLRNRIAHSYGDLDPIRMVREAPVGLDHAEQFISELTTVIAGD